MGNKKNKELSKCCTRKRRKNIKNDGMFGSKKRKSCTAEVIPPSTLEYDLKESSSQTESTLLSLIPISPVIVTYDKKQTSEECFPIETKKQAANEIKNDDETYFIETEPRDIFESVKGKRIIDMNYFCKQLKDIMNHSALFNCTSQSLSLMGEKRVGLVSKFKFKCDMCGSCFFINSEDPAHTENVDTNIGAVIAIVSSGIGYSQFEEILSSINIPIFCERYFAKIQNSLFDKWEAAAADEMQVAAERERQAAISEGSVKDGIAIIDVYADGCWSKRSYGNNYRALSGAAAIIGRRYGEVLYMAVKNKYCLICARAQKKDLTPKEHICFKNYNGSSPGMESEIICEGFKRSVEMYNIMYGRLIADGDSSTYAKILALNPYPNTIVEKIECRNHIFRNLCNKLRGTSKDVKYPLQFRKLMSDQKVMATRKVIVRSIKEQKDSLIKGDTSKPQAINNLHADIQNSILHAFGDHRMCKNYYCNKEKTLLNAMEVTSSTYWFRLRYIIGTVASKSRSLIEDVDTNTAERFNSIIAKIVGGKRIFFSARRAYQGRCAAAVVSFNNRLPRYTLQKRCLGNSPKNRIKKMEENRNMKKIRNRKYLQKRNRTYTKTTHDYGIKSTAPDMPEEDLKKATEEFLNNLKDMTKDKNRIQQETILQRDSSEWLQLRKNMVTASSFGKVIKRRKNTSYAPLVKNIIYKENIAHVASIAHGIENEKIALQQLAKQENVIIMPCGLFVDNKYSFIGATPDGIIGDDTLVELKCPVAAYKKNIEDAIKDNKVQIYKYNKNKDSYAINKNSDWFYQVQGQLHVANKKKCLFAVWGGQNVNLKIEYIERDDNFWAEKMEQSLIYFYMKCMLPELVNPRHTRGMPIRDPLENKENEGTAYRQSSCHQARRLSYNEY